MPAAAVTIPRRSEIVPATVMTVSDLLPGCPRQLWPKTAVLPATQLLSGAAPVTGACRQLQYICACKSLLTRVMGAIVLMGCVMSEPHCIFQSATMLL